MGVKEISVLPFVKMDIIMGRYAYHVRSDIMDGINSKHAIHAPVIAIHVYHSFHASYAKLVSK
jgi:hypothetical protein